VTGKVIYGPDCSSFQGSPDWARVSASCRFGAEKVTEGTGYVNPRWAASRTAMLRIAGHGFVPLAYLFLDAKGSGSAQASFFAEHAGDLSRFGIAVDYERAPDGSPTHAQAADAVAELRKLYPRHPVGGYAPHWYTGGQSLTFADWLWASSYVSGGGDPAALYGHVPASWWAPYGGRTPVLLQFTDKASISGISGPVDCSAFHGTEAQLAARVLPAAAQPKPTAQGDEMIIPLVPGQPPVSFPVWADAAEYKEPAAYASCSLGLAGQTGAVVHVTLHDVKHGPQTLARALTTGKAVHVVPAHGWSAVTAVDVKRTDTRAAVGASAVFRTW
jgi:GH25 family lysozyme M1 (1,4-beta-N-acetylmuramidase)